MVFGAMPVSAAAFGLPALPRVELPRFELTAARSTAAPRVSDETEAANSAPQDGTSADASSPKGVAAKPQRRRAGGWRSALPGSIR
jgi:hypothetical protein